MLGTICNLKGTGVDMFGLKARFSYYATMKEQFSFCHYEGLKE